MHSRIFGIVTKKHYDNYIKEEGEMKMPIWQFEQSLPYGMDYVDDDTDLNEDFEWFIECLRVHTTKFEANFISHTIKFFPGFKEEYFEKAWNQIQELINGQNAYKHFCTDSMFSFKIREATDEHYGFYQCDEEGYYDTFDNFIRDVDADVEYAVFGSLDYHS